AEYRKHVEFQLGPAPKPGLPPIEALARGDPRSLKGAPGNYDMLLSDVLNHGWPKEDRAVGRWLDRLFQGEWVSLAKKAAQLPLGLVQDPRLGRREEHESVDAPWECHQMARLLMARALQLQAKGDSRGALDLLETTLALSRQLRHDAPSFPFA